MTTDTAQKACIFCNGRLSNPSKVREIAEDCGLLIAANGGTRYCADLGLTPHVIIGDADSNGSDKWKNNSEIERIRESCMAGSSL